ncbi:Paraquat-inducible protein A [Tritonibacter multivorans]|uniref:Paraquat-inducible protein A n=1 Tax=Tritonibacter multivorans TaxID=928856 RepID=A0A0P1GTH5_9RHOB|nr:paraquat-inducible protein A [Tritonibacter multivorans]MDA7422111.1 paraquat-inducible protein A [Tritonibacter multivorans]CUH78444.1 Paraquat-inducible protein A [Tritonibacter multivorans]SFD16973.1 paraquat-inducible protein A [Tritonibacter multivorans]
MRAIDLGLVGCHVCGTVHDASEVQCRTCGAMVQARRAGSLQAAWAWVVASILCLIPGNLFPLLVNNILGTSSAHTIFEGVILFVESGNYAVAFVIFAASMCLPIAKIAIILFLLLSIQFRWKFSHHMRLTLHDFIEFIGRWSMIDIFVVALLTGLVQLSPVASIEPAVGALFFAASVICSMLAAQSIDPKLIWDSPT